MRDEANNQGMKTTKRIKKKHLLLYSLIFVLAPLATFFLGRMLDQMLSLPKWPAIPINLITGLAVFFTGLSIGIKSTRLLLMFGSGLPWGELNGNSQSRRLVTTGMYAYTRNPMTLGYSLLPCGMGLMFQSISMTLIITAVTMTASSAWAKFREEPRLEQRFGMEYLEYKERTPFLIPSPTILFAGIAHIASAIMLQSGGQNKRPRKIEVLSFALTSISVVCLILITLLTFYYRPAELSAPKQFAISIFIGICLLGATAAVVPSKCSQTLHHRRHESYLHRDTMKPLVAERAVVVKGHHPACGSFSNHVFRIDERTYCAGCMGLLTGAIISIAASSLFFFDIFRFPGVSTMVFWLGFASVLLGLFQYIKPLMRRASIHFLSNIVFVFGAFLMLVGVIEINGDLLVEAYFLFIVVYWIVTRIILSNREHKRICATCNSSSCTYFHR